MFLTVTYSAMTVGLLLPVCAVLVTYLLEWPWQLQLCFCIYALCLPPRMDFTQCVPKAARKVHPGHLCCTGWWLFFFLQLRITLHLDFLLLFYFQQFHNERFTLGFLHCDTVSFTFFFARLCLCPFHHPPALTTPTQLYVCDALYRHLVHIEDCHCHLLLITVTCTLRSAINT